MVNHLKVIAEENSHEPYQIIAEENSHEPYQIIAGGIALIDFSGWKPQKNPYSLVLMILLIAALITITAELTPGKIMSLLLFKSL